MSTDTTDTAGGPGIGGATTGVRRSGVRRAEVELVASTVAVVGITAGVAWWTTRIGGANLTMLATLACACAGAAVVNLVGGRSGRGVRRTAVLVTVIVGGTLLVLAGSGALVRTKAQSTMAAWAAGADAVLAADDPGSVCESFPVDPPELAMFGRVDQRCASRLPGQRWVSFDQKDPTGGWTGLVYSPDSEPHLMSQCVAHLDGPFWQTASADPGCPSGMAFRGGG